MDRSGSYISAAVFRVFCARVTCYYASSVVVKLCSLQHAGLVFFAGYLRVSSYEPCYNRLFLFALILGELYSTKVYRYNFSISWIFVLLLVISTTCPILSSATVHATSANVINNKNKRDKHQVAKVITKKVTRFLWVAWQTRSSPRFFRMNA